MSNFEKLFNVKIKGAPGVNKEVAQISKAFQAATKIVNEYRKAIDSAMKSQVGGQVQLVTKQLLELKEATRGNLELAKQLQAQNKASGTTEKQSARNKTELNALERERAKLLARNETLHAKLTLAQSKEAKVIEQTNQRLLQQNKLNRQQAKNIANLLSPYERLSANLNNLRKRYKDLVVSGKENDAQTKRLLSTIKKMDAELKRVDASAGQFQRNVGNYNGAIGRLRTGFTNLAGAMGVSLGLFGAFRLVRNSISIIKDFEKQIAILGGISRATTEELALLKEQAQELGSTTEFTATEVAELQTAYARLGLTVKQIQAVTEPTLRGATALQAELGDTATLVGATLKAFQIDVSESERVVDSLAASTQRSALDFSKLQTSLAIVAPVAKNANVSLEQTLGLLGTLTDRGLDASTAGTSLRNIFLELSKKGIGLNDALAKISNATDKNAVALELFGKRSSTAATILADNQEGFNELATSIENAGGAAQELAEKQLDTLDGAFKLLRSAWEGFILDANEGTGIGNIFKETILFIAENIRVLIGALTAVAVAYGAYRVQLALANKESFLAVTVDKLQALSKGKLSVATRIATFAQRLFNAALKANPILLVIGLVASLIAGFKALYERNETVRKSFDEVKRALYQIFEAFKPVIDAVRQIVAVFSKTLAPVIKKLVDNVIAPLINIWLKKLAFQFRLVAGGISAFVSVFSFAADKIKEIAGGFIDTLKGIFTIDRDLIRKGIDRQVSGFKTLFKGLGKAAKDGFKEGFGTDDVVDEPKKPTTSSTSGGTIGNVGGSGGGSSKKDNAAKRKAEAEKRKREEQKRLDEEFAQRKKQIERQRDEEIEFEQKKLDAINADERKTNIERTEALLNFYDRKEEITISANTKLLQNEKKYKKLSEDNEYARQKELQKIDEEQSKIRATKQLQLLKDLEQQKSNDLVKLELEFAEKRTKILTSGASKSRQAQRLQQLSNVEEQAKLSFEIVELENILKLKKELFDKGLITEKEYYDSKLALQKKANELLQSEQEKEIFSFNNNLETFVKNIDKLLGDVGLQQFGQVIAEGFAIAKQAMSDYYNTQRENIALEREDRLEQIALERDRLQADAQSAQEREFIDKQYQAKKDKIDQEASEKYRKIKKAELTIAYFTELANIAVAAAANPTNGVTFGGAGAAQYALLAGLATVRYGLGLNNIAKQKFELGGLPSGGGNIGGDSHANGGTPFNMGEAERNETAIITKGVNKQQRMVVGGTAHQILSAVNKSGGGIDFAPGALMKRFEFGGYLGTNLNAPVLPEETFNVSRGTSEFASAFQDQQNRLEQYITATNKRIDRIKVGVSTKEISNAQDRDAKQVEVASIFSK